MNIVIDVDDICADLMTVWVQLYNEKWDDDLTIEEIADWDWFRFTKRGVAKEEIKEIINNQEFYSVIQPIPGSKEAIAELRALGHRIIFVTCALNGHAGAKHRWLRFYGFLDDNHERDYVECCDKGIIDADVIIDDNPKNVSSFLNKGKIGILFDRNWNRNYTPENQNGVFYRSKSWKDIIKFLKG